MQCAHERVRGLPGTVWPHFPFDPCNGRWFGHRNVDPGAQTGDQSGGLAGLALDAVQDHHVSEVLDQPQLWVSDDWSARFGLTPDPWNLGFGHQTPDIATVKPESAQALIDYYDAVYARTRPILEGLTPEALSEVVDDRWDPPVTLGVRLISVADDSLQHVGQAAYVRGLVEQGWHIGY